MAPSVEPMSAATSGAYAIADAEPSGDGTGFVALYRAHASFTWACLRRLGVPAAGIDDAMQELWVTAHRRLASLHSMAAAKSWLYGIARRVASHHRRTEQRHRRKLDAIGDTAPRHDVAARESELVVESILAHLDARVREAFVLSELEGWSAPEIARATGANANTIYWRVRVARQELQSQLGADEEAANARVIELREATRAPRGVAKHCWVLIAPELVAPSVVGSMFASWGAMKTVLLAAGVTICAATTIELGLRSEPAASTAQLPAAPVLQTSPVAELAAVAALPSVASEPVPAASVAPIATPAEPRARPHAAPTVPAPHALPATMDADDAGLLRDATLALGQSRLHDAELAVASHRERFPASELGDLRDFIDVRVRCATGDERGARALADRIVARAPGSAVASKLASTCVGKP
jgi:RNA polymerase sigma-70 factor (ECF subfamily)